MIYLDNAASTWTKPKAVSQAMAEAIELYAANPGRGEHKLAQKAASVIHEARTNIAKLFNIKDPNRIAFFQNATGALNQAIQGLDWKEGDHVISTTYEHNSVRRPLEWLKRKYGVKVTYVMIDPNESFDSLRLENRLTENTKLIACTHISNLTGQILPIEQIGSLASKHGIPLLVDASQSAGYMPINVEEMNIDLLAFAGHKGLYGPQGTGVLYVTPDVELTPLYYGGTGRFSESVDMPKEMPERLEAGTLNTPGIAGLNEGVKFVLNEGIDKLQQHEDELTDYALNGLFNVGGITVYGPNPGIDRGPVIAFNIEGVHSQEVAHILDEHYQIAVRSGLHCTPLGHESIQTAETGAIRISFSFFNKMEEIDQLLTALKEIKIGLLGD